VPSPAIFAVAAKNWREKAAATFAARCDATVHKEAKGNEVWVVIKKSEAGFAE